MSNVKLPFSMESVVSQLDSFVSLSIDNNHYYLIQGAEGNERLSRISARSFMLDSNGNILTQPLGQWTPLDRPTASAIDVLRHYFNFDPFKHVKLLDEDSNFKYLAFSRVMMTSNFYQDYVGKAVRRGQLEVKLEKTDIGYSFKVSAPKTPLDGRVQILNKPFFNLEKPTVFTKPGERINYYWQGSDKEIMAHHELSSGRIITNRIMAQELLSMMLCGTYIPSVQVEPIISTNTNSVLTRDMSACPDKLTSADFSWIRRNESKNARRLCEEYPEGTVDPDGEHFVPGDPRNTVQALRGGMFLAEQNNSIGIYSEASIPVVPGDSPAVLDNGDVVVTEDTLLSMAREYASLIPRLNLKYPSTKFFVAAHNRIYQGRMALCAFTPLVELPGFSFCSPYIETDSDQESPINTLSVIHSELRTLTESSVVDGTQHTPPEKFIA